MSVLPVVTIPDKMLRQRARPVTRFDAELQALIDNMIETMRSSEGVGLAGPQVGVPIRLAVIETPPEMDEEGKEIEDTRELFVVANPEIIWTSRTVQDGVEGCLSIPGYVGEVERFDSIRVRAQDRYGKKVRYRLRDWTARIFQHEIDHLNGILYIDKLTAPENIWTDEEFEKMMEEKKKKKEAEQAEPMIGD
jgi:peptide deformylase